MRMMSAKSAPVMPFFFPFLDFSNQDTSSCPIYGFMGILDVHVHIIFVTIYVHAGVDDVSLILMAKHRL